MWMLEVLSGLFLGLVGLAAYVAWDMCGSASSAWQAAKIALLSIGVYILLISLSAESLLIDVTALCFFVISMMMTGGILFVSLQRSRF